jgi:hypothetical protein
MILEYSLSSYPDSVWTHRVTYQEGTGGSLIAVSTDNIDAWCVNTFGEESYVRHGLYWGFKTKEDAMMFILRWA